MSTTLAHGPEPSYCVGRILPGKPLSPSPVGNLLEVRVG